MYYLKPNRIGFCKIWEEPQEDALEIENLPNMISHVRGKTIGIFSDGVTAWRDYIEDVQKRHDDAQARADIDYIAIMSDIDLEV